MSSLQIALVIAGVVLIVGVVGYNLWQERHVRMRMRDPSTPPAGSGSASAQRVEPTLSHEAGTPQTLPARRAASSVARPDAQVAHDPAWQVPMDGVVGLAEGEKALGTVADDSPAERSALAEEHPADPSRRARAVSPAAAAPDPDIETIVTLQPVRPVAASALAAGLHARLGKPVRWYGRREDRGNWQRLATDSRGDYDELAACMLLADRNGPATQAQIEAFRNLVADIAAGLPGVANAADSAEEAQRAEALDRLCAELDMQIGLTVRKMPPATISGTRLRGVAEASGFRLAPTGRFEWVQDDTGAVLFTLQSVTDEAFTAESLRTGTSPGVVFLLDVPRVADPPRAFDQMKLAAKRMAQTVGGELVDDNGRLLNDAGLTAIREQVGTANAALRRFNIEPGSPRAFKLFAA